MTEFVGFPKIARYSRDAIVTEKIDGTNSCIRIGEDGEFLTGSRNRWITPEDDNFGFAKWAQENKEDLLTLGSGLHFGEWWGSGIQRGYGLPKGEKRFSLFNVSRWCLFGTVAKRMPTQGPRQEKYQDVLPPCCGLVPVLWQGLFDDLCADEIISGLKSSGSVASPGFMNPEGIVIWHVAGKIGFKKTIERDNERKGQA